MKNHPLYKRFANLYHGVRQTTFDQIGVHFTDKPLAFWSKCAENKNFGDQLTPYIIHAVRKKRPTWVSPSSAHVHYVFSGSVIKHCMARSVVWGAGLSSVKRFPSEQPDIRAVRGPITRRLLLENGIECPEIYGDPGLVLPLLYPASRAKAHRVGVVPHFSEYGRVSEACKKKCPGDVVIVSLTSSVEDVAQSIASCELVVSSSLHGVIVAHAYGVPAVWVYWDFSARRQDLKFRDYFESVGAFGIRPITLCLSELIAMGPSSLSELSVLPLSGASPAFLEAFPLKERLSLS